MVLRTIRLATAVLIGCATLAPTAATAQYRGQYRGAPPPAYYEPTGYDRDGYDRSRYDRARNSNERREDDRSRARQDRRGRHCDRGTGGTILGAIAGGLLGNAVAGRGDRGVGTIVGAGAGALAGRAIDRDC